VFYTAFAPYEKPRVAIAVILENGGGEGVSAAPVVRNILDHIFLPDEQENVKAG
jgi:penicillin-binding protein 2